MGFALGKATPDQEVDYCCSGCRTVASLDQVDAQQGIVANHLLRLGLAIFFTMNVMVFTMALWSQSVYPESQIAGPLASALRSVFRWASLLFSLPVLWLLGNPILQGVRQAARRRTVTTDLLILIGVAAAYGYSVVSVVRGEGHVYFEVGSMVLVFVSLGRWLEAKGKLRTGESLDRLANLLPENVRCLQPDGSYQELPRTSVRTGDVLRVLPGERIPLDGTIVDGEAHLDQQMVTGESQFAVSTVGNSVYGGTLNVDGDLRVEVTAENGQETLSRLIQLIRTARSQKGRHEQLADRITTWFVPAVCLIAIGAGWRQAIVQGIDSGILTGLAVALIACPCALGLATPMAVWAALGRAAESGVLFRSGRVLEKLAEVRFACFDKTGTLTEGQPLPAELLLDDGVHESEVLTVAASLAAGSTHQLSHAIVQFAKQDDSFTSPPMSLNVSTLPGKGLRSSHAALGEVLLGSRRLFEQVEYEFPRSLHNRLVEDGDSQWVFVGWAGRVRGAFRFEEQLRPEATQAVRVCQEMRVDIRLLTGDSAGRADAVGRQLGLQAASSQLPEDKYAAIRELSQQGSVAMIGDGLNDAPALAAADVGVALGCGADISRDAAGVCLLGNDLHQIPWSIGLARMTARVVRQNLFWAFAYNCAGIALAATGNLNPVWAALAMAASSLVVIVNSLRLGRYSGALNEDNAIESFQPSEALTPKPSKPDFVPGIPHTLAEAGS